MSLKWNAMHITEQRDDAPACGRKSHMARHSSSRRPLMSTKPYDLVLRGGTVATSSAVFPADVAIEGETIAAVGRDLPPGANEIDACGKLVLASGIETHTRIEQRCGPRSL